MAINVWSAGNDAMLDFVARRDAERRLNEDRARRDRLDAESAEDRALGRRIQQESLSSIDEDRKARRELAEQAAKERADKAQADALNAEQIGTLLDAYDAARTPEEKHSIGLKILNAGGKYQAAPRDPAPPRPVSVSPGSTLVDPTTGRPVYTAPDRPEKPAASERDDPSLPVGVKAYIDSLPTKIDEQGRRYTVARALDELSRNARNLRSAHPRLDLAAAARYAKALFPAGATDLEAMLGADEPTPAAPSSAQPAQAAPAAPAAPAASGFNFLEASAQKNLEAAAVAELQRRGKAVTPETIAQAIQILSSGGQ